MVKVQKASEHLHSGGGERFDAGECLRQAEVAPMVSRRV